MKITLEPTGHIETMNGVDARIWKGTTEKGVAITCWIPIIQVGKKDDQTEFERELREIKVERRLVSFDMRML
jgi:hypothetical protein